MKKIPFVVLAFCVTVPILSWEALAQDQQEPAKDPALAVADSAAASPEPAAGSGLIGITFAPKLGAVIPTSELGVNYALGLEAGYTFPWLKDKLPGFLSNFELSINAEFDLMMPTKSGAGTSDLVGGTYTYDLTQRIMILSFDALIKFTPWVVQPYGGIGWGMYFLHAEQSSYDMTNIEDQLYSGMQLRAGVEWDIWHGGLIGEVRYHYTGLGFLSTGDTNAGGVTISAGYRFIF